MLSVDPGYWLIALAIGVFFLTAVVILASSMISDDEQALSALPLNGRAGKNGTGRH